MPRSITAWKREALKLPGVHARQPVPAIGSRWADPRIAGITAIPQCLYVCTILVDPRFDLISSADRPVARDEHIDLARHALQQPQRGQVVLDRVSSVPQVEHWNQDIRKHVSRNENAALEMNSAAWPGACP